MHGKNLSLAGVGHRASRFSRKEEKSDLCFKRIALAPVLRINCEGIGGGVKCGSRETRAEDNLINQVHDDGGFDHGDSSGQGKRWLDS